MIAWVQRQAIVLGIIAALFAALTVQTVRVNNARNRVVALSGELKNVKANLQASETLRALEHVQAMASYADTTERCEARIITARDSAAAIKGIVNAPYVKGLGGVRAIVGADQLRRVAGQSAGGTTSLPARSNGAASK